MCFTQDNSLVLPTDDRFILKQMSRFEVQSFVEFAPHYFQYITKAHNEQVCVWVYACLCVRVWSILAAVWWGKKSVLCVCVCVCVQVWRKCLIDVVCASSVRCVWRVWRIWCKGGGEKIRILWMSNSIDLIGCGGDINQSESCKQCVYTKMRSQACLGIV